MIIITPAMIPSTRISVPMVIPTSLEHVHNASESGDSRLPEALIRFKQLT